jgi:hypothetical protein
MSLPLPNEAEVFRLVSHNDEHFPPDAPKPHPVAFAVTKADREEGERRQQPPSLSVWDREKTTPAQGRQIRRNQAAAAERIAAEMTPFAWKVGVLHELLLENETEPRLTVVADPLEASEGPGADGHAGIQGLDGKKAEQKRDDKKRLLRSRLVDACYRLIG